MRGTVGVHPGLCEFSWRWPVPVAGVSCLPQESLLLGACPEKAQGCWSPGLQPTVTGGEPERPVRGRRQKQMGVAGGAWL